MLTVLQFSQLVVQMFQKTTTCLAWGNLFARHCFLYTHIRPHTCWYPQLAFALLQRCFAPFWYELFGWSSTPDEPTVTVRLISVDCWPPISAFVELRCVILKATIPPPWVTRGWRAGLCCASATWTAWSEEFEEFSYCVALCSTQDATVSPWRLLEKQRLLQSGKNPLPKLSARSALGVPWAENDLEHFNLGPCGVWELEMVAFDLWQKVSSEDCKNPVPSWGDVWDLCKISSQDPSGDFLCPRTFSRYVERIPKGSP